MTEQTAILDKGQLWRLLTGDARTVLRSLPDESVNCCVSSPPYFGLRDYGVDGQIGLEQTPEEYVAQIVAVFGEVHRMLTKDGTLWLNLGDSFAGGGGFSPTAPTTKDSKSGKYGAQGALKQGGIKPGNGLKAKDLIGIPWMVAFALRADGWYLRSDIVWSKPNPMPESVTDRPTKAHEYIFLLTKSAKYFYDHEAIKEPLESSSIQRLSQKNFDNQTGGAKDYAVTGQNENRSMRRALVNLKGHAMPPQVGDAPERWANLTGRNKRSVWEIAPKPFPDAHFAVFPPELVQPCIRAGCPVGGIVLDPFTGSGTTGEVALEEGRRFIGVELNPKYSRMATRRIGGAKLALDFDTEETTAQTA